MNDRATAIQDFKQKRSAMDQVGTWLMGDKTDDTTAYPPSVDVPGPPGFAPTANPNIPWSPPSIE